ncbi:C-type lectin domain family 4 member M-like isoform X1 [Scleropages formosus]|uniref:C-type lectin domain family 4 member M-like isoform X1 n=2 Tax=Scleropages formosus TaxID=113540 RepID=UPI0010FAB5E9|nr:C-type lectin domain family 4 member M-like isoform X1 [Scleropages formosus]
MSDKVVYSAVKFKNSYYTDPETQCDVIYSEVKICEPLSTQKTSSEKKNAVSTEKTGTSALHHRAALMSLALLCAVLLTVIIVLGASLNSISEDFYAMEEDLAKFKANYSFLVNETGQLQEVFRSLNKDKRQQQEDFNNLFTENVELQERFRILIKNQEELQKSYDKLDEEKKELQNNFNILTNDKSQLQENYSILVKGKEQLQNKYNIFSKKLHVLDQYCPSICKDGSIKKSTRSSTSENLDCNLCPHGWKNFNSKCYYISKLEYGTWTQSKDYCTTHRAHLVIIDDEDEKNFINKHITRDYWIGLYREARMSAWTWVDNTPLGENRFWQKGQPGNLYYYSKECVISNAAGWKKESCYSHNFWVCETEALIF